MGPANKVRGGDNLSKWREGGKKVLSYEMFSLWPEWFKMPNGCIFVTVHFIAT